ncbi:unnamed protein product [Tuber melanosporum]|uniref:(Perigord truffle) hypothetical protein n=1 Tax=Tuber melanosporum (strain Mel28) TaxID=656061 RepID=D5GK27_TUBMM|nr:uncharacterized protein GSTUM_00009334001 [Tuber melanosporum]CAZ84870.1 unnamed protein product [Tuber melanosporum]
MRAVTHWSCWSNLSPGNPDLDYECEIITGDRVLEYSYLGCLLPTQFYPVAGLTVERICVKSVIIFPPSFLLLLFFFWGGEGFE